MGELRKVADKSELGPGQTRSVDIGGQRVAVFNVGGNFYAIGDTCTHRGGPLSAGEVVEQEKRVICPWHGANYDLATGAVLSPPAPKGVPSYRVVVEGNDVLIELP